MRGGLGATLPQAVGGAGGAVVVLKESANDEDQLGGRAFVEKRLPVWNGIVDCPRMRQVSTAWAASYTIGWSRQATQRNADAAACHLPNGLKNLLLGFVRFLSEAHVAAIS